jgi:hypothetical protein
MDDVVRNDELLYFGEWFIYLNDHNWKSTKSSVDRKYKQPNIIMVDNQQQRSIERTYMNHFSSTDSLEEELSSSSGGSLSDNHDRQHPNDNMSKRRKHDTKHHEYFLSCGMMLPKRRRRRYRSSYSNDQDQVFEEHEDNYQVASNEPPPSVSSTVQYNLPVLLRSKAHRRPLTPFPSLLVQDTPFQEYVTRIDSKQYDRCNNMMVDNLNASSLMSKCVSSPSPLITASSSSFTTRTEESCLKNPIKTTTLIQRLDSINCEIVLSHQVYSMTDAIEFSTKPHCLIEATEPHRVLHANAALYTLLLHAESSKETTSLIVSPLVSSDDEIKAATICDVTLHDLLNPIHVQSQSTPLSLSTSTPLEPSTSWDAMQIKLSQLFGGGYISSLPNYSCATTSTKSTITLYPVHSPKSDYDHFLEPLLDASLSSPSCCVDDKIVELQPPRYYLIEISSSCTNQIDPTSTSSDDMALQHKIMNMNTPKDDAAITSPKYTSSSMDCLPKFVIA